MYWFEEIQESVFDVLFPPRCVACQSPGEWWCESCRRSVQGCPTNIPLSSSMLDGLVSTGWYHDEKMRAMIITLKYRGATCVLPSVAQHIVDWRESRLGAWPWAGEQDLAIQYVPASPSRVRSRGFDQAECIAKIIQKELVPWGKMTQQLQRCDENRLTQASLVPGPLRHANVQDLFFCAPIKRIPECALLIDDVYTTGSTMQEAARVLKHSGVKRVYGFVLAVGK